MSINYGAQIYPNCFDQLTTHGIVAEDVVVILQIRLRRICKIMLPKEAATPPLYRGHLLYRAECFLTRFRLCHRRAAL